VPGETLSLAALNRMLKEAEDAFTTKDYTTAASKIDALIKALGPKPKPALLETSLYHLAMTHCLNNEEKKTKAACGEYLTKYPTGLYAGDMRARIGDPAVEQVEYLIDELVKTLVPHKKATAADADALDKQLVDVLTKVLGDKPNPTATVRLFYARARLSQLLNRSEHAERSDLLLKGIATHFATDPSALSPTLLSACGDSLLNQGNLDGADAMYKRLDVNYKESMFADAGPYGLGLVALARKQPDAALRIFETTLGKLQALIDLGEFDTARTQADEIAGDKMYRGEAIAKALLLKAWSYRAEAAKAGVGSDAGKELLAKAHAVYQHIYAAYQSLSRVGAEAYWQAYATAKELNEYQAAAETLKTLAKNPKLQNSQRAKEAPKLSA
jgi:hypothetical protein